MSKLGVISDVHADISALRTALTQLDKHGCDQIVCAGDLVSYSDRPEETIQLIASRGISCVQGNHDRWGARDGWDLDGGHELSWQAKRFLRALPPNLIRTISGVRISIWHARPHDDMEGVYSNAPADELRDVLKAADANVLVVGHTHKPMIVVGNGRMIINPGALLCHEDRSGTYGVLELPLGRWCVFRVEDGVRVRGLRQRYVGGGIWSYAAGLE